MIIIIILESETHKLVWDFEKQTNHQISVKRPKKKKKDYNLQNCGLCCSGRPQSKIERKGKKGLVPGTCKGIEKNLWNMKVTLIPIVIGVIGIVTKGLRKGIEGLEIRRRGETIQTIKLLTSACIQRRVRETCCHSNSSERPSAEADMKKKNSQGVK